MKILVAEDDRTTVLILRRALVRAGHQVTVTEDGAAALAVAQREPFDALLTDWLMPRMDGIELVRNVRETIRPTPIIVVLTAVTSAHARSQAIDAGADDYLAKPCVPQDVIRTLEACYARHHQAAPVLAPVRPTPSLVRPPFVGVSIAASTGGPNALTAVFKQLTPSHRAAILMVLHGPAWMLETFARRLSAECRIRVTLAEDGMVAEPGQAYLAPGERHTTLERGLVLRVRDGEQINYVKPAADPLFQTAAGIFGQYHLGVVFTGMGRDGGAGSRAIREAGGVVVAQDPATAVATSMPRTVIEAKLASEVAPLDRLAEVIDRHVTVLASRLQGSGSRAAPAAEGVRAVAR